MNKLKIDTENLKTSPLSKKNLLDRIKEGIEKLGKHPEKEKDIENIENAHKKNEKEVRKENRKYPDPDINSLKIMDIGTRKYPNIHNSINPKKSIKNSLQPKFDIAAAKAQHSDEKKAMKENNKSNHTEEVAPLVPSLDSKKQLKSKLVNFDTKSVRIEEARVGQLTQAKLVDILSNNSSRKQGNGTNLKGDKGKINSTMLDSFTRPTTNKNQAQSQSQLPKGRQKTNKLERSNAIKKMKPTRL